MRWLEELLQDAQYGLRSLRSHPTFTLVALLTLALGIGANALIFSLVSGVLLRPLPYDQPDRIVQIYETTPAFGRGAVSHVQTYRSNSTLVEAMAGYVPNSRVSEGPAGPERVGVVLAERSLFRVLGVDAAFGRTFRDDDEAGVLVVAAPFARRRFGHEAAAIGQTISLEGQSSVIVGVMPETFRFPYLTSRLPGTLASARYELWMAFDVPPNPRARLDFVVGRLKPEATLSSAQDEMNATARRLGDEFPQSNAGNGIELVSLRENIVGSVRPQLMVLLGVVGLVLLAACANVANLLLVRGSTRTRETAIRTAIGAGRSRLVRQFLTESMLLSLGGGALGLLLVQWGTPLLLAVAGSRLPRADDIGIDWRVFAFLLLTSVATGIVFGLVPALAAARTDVQAALKGSTVVGGSNHFFVRVRDALVAAEIALAFVLVIGAGLLVREFERLRSTESGMNPSNVLTLHLAPNVSAADCYSIVSQVEALPGVRAAAFAQMLPLQSWGWTATISIAGRPVPSPAERPVVELRYITPRYFEALGIPIRSGRAFTNADTAAAPRVIIVNEALARRYFGNTDPVGQQTDRGTVVGVAADVRQTGLDRAALPDVYYPIAQNVSQIRDLGMTLIVATRLPPASVAATVRESIGRSHPRLAVFGVKTMDEVVSDSLSDSTFYTWLVGSFAALALILACAGIYGVMSFVVAARTREFGIRLALGAEGGSVRRLVLSHAAILVAIGLGVGLGGVAVFSRFLESLIVGAGRVQLVTVAAAGTLLGAVALLACLVPARRAARVDPIDALRQD
jgi:putative ABC transport system permease protein